MHVIGFLLIGAIAGWLAGLIMKGRSQGLLGNMVVGVLGSVVGGFVFQTAGIAAGGFVTALIGAIVLLFVVNKLKS